MIDLPARIGPYLVRGELGRGGMGIVYRALDPVLGREVAIKLVLAARRERFQREAQALARLRHPGVVQVHAAGEHEGRPYVVLDLVEGETLEGRIRRSGPLPGAEVARIGARIARALEHVHASGLLHRDLKPANVLLDARTGEPLLTDFGLSLDLAEVERLSHTGAIIGSLWWCPPEQGRGEMDRIGPWSDLYGLGATLYHLLTGRPPHPADTPAQALLSMEEGPTPLAELAPDVDPRLARLVERCLARRPEDRPTSAAEVAAELERRSEARAPRNALAISATALAILAIGAGTAAVLLRASAREGDPRRPEAAAGSGATSPSSASPAGPASASPLRSADADLAAGNACLDRMSWADALAAFERALAAEPERVEARLGRAVALAEQGRAAEAEPILVEGLALLPDYQVGWTSLAAIRINRDRPQEALDALARAPRTTAHVEALRGLALVRQRRWGEAERALDAALGLEPAHPTAAGWRGLARLGQGRAREALEDLTVACERLPDAAWPRIDRARALLHMGRPEEAQVQLDEARARLQSPHPEALALRAWILNGRGLHAGAVELANHALTLDARCGSALTQRGLAWTRQGQVDRGVEDLLAGAQLRPDDPLPRLFLGQLYLAQDRYQEAVAELTRALEVYPGHAGALALRAAALIGEDRLGDAEADASLAIENQARNRLAFTNRGLARLGLGKHAEALQDGDAALAIDGADPWAHAVRGLALASLGEEVEAIPNLERAWTGLDPSRSLRRRVEVALEKARAAAGR